MICQSNRGLNHSERKRALREVLRCVPQSIKLFLAHTFDRFQEGEHWFFVRERLFFRSGGSCCGHRKGCWGRRRAGVRMWYIVGRLVLLLLRRSQDSWLVWTIPYASRMRRRYRLRRRRLRRWRRSSYWSQWRRWRIKSTTTPFRFWRVDLAWNW